MSDPAQNDAEMARPIQLTARQAIVLAVMPVGRPVPTRWVAEQINVPAAHIPDTLLVLEQRGLVRHHRATPEDRDAWGGGVRHLWTRRV